VRTQAILRRAFDPNSLELKMVGYFSISLLIEYNSYMQLLPYIRLSMLDDQSTSPERQLEKIERFARLGGHQLVEA
jgi:hypothetical protein